MEQPWQKFELDETVLFSLAKKTEGKSGIFSLQSEPLLASLISCLGLQFEFGKPELDRSSILLGIDPTKNSWESEIITYQGMFGLRAWVRGVEELKPLHEDFAQILHPLSLSPQGQLFQLVIFPALVAKNYAKRGIELVVVKEWALSAFLGRDKKLNYQRTNYYEIEGNIALTQMDLMQNRQLAFTGTHDLGDHLLGAKTEGLAACDILLREMRKTYAQVFTQSQNDLQNRELIISYLIAVLLDDLAQPQWYGSVKHLYAAYSALSLMQEVAIGQMPLFLPQSFHDLVECLRRADSAPREHQYHFRLFAKDLQRACTQETKKPPLRMAN